MKNDLRKKTVGELKTLLADKTKAFRDFSLNLTKTKSKNVKEGKNLKKEIAQILTLINEEKNKKA